MTRTAKTEAARHAFFAAVLTGLTIWNLWLMSHPVDWMRMDLGWRWVLGVALGALAVAQVDKLFDALRDDPVVEQGDDGVTCNCGSVEVLQVQPPLTVVPDNEEE